MQDDAQSPESLWQNTPVANLVRYRPSGTLFARVRIKGKLIRRSLRTKVLSVGKLRLADLEKAERQSAEHAMECVGGRMTFGDALAVRAVNKRFSQDAADLIEFLAFGGFRKSEAKNIRWSDCDFGRGEILVRGDPETGTENWTVTTVPMIPEMRRLLEKLAAERPEGAADGNVMAVSQCNGSLKNACQRVGIPPISHHDLRHLFATTCIESGVNIPTVARWLGHKDCGALAMKVYGHLRYQHSHAMAKTVQF